MVKLSPMEVAVRADVHGKTFIEEFGHLIDGDIDEVMAFCLGVIMACGAIYRAHEVEHGHAQSIAVAALNEVYSV